MLMTRWAIVLLSMILLAGCASEGRAECSICTGQTCTPIPNCSFASTTQEKYAPSQCKGDALFPECFDYPQGWHDWIVERKAEIEAEKKREQEALCKQLRSDTVNALNALEGYWYEGYWITDAPSSPQTRQAVERAYVAAEKYWSNCEHSTSEEKILLQLVTDLRDISILMSK